MPHRGRKAMKLEREGKLKSAETVNHKHVSSQPIPNGFLPEDGVSPCSTAVVVRETSPTEGENPFRKLYREFYPSQREATPTLLPNPFFGSTMTPSVWKLHFHLCSAVSDEALFGLMAREAEQLSCCLLKSLVALSPAHPLYKTGFTPFGRRLSFVCRLRGIDLGHILSNELFFSWWRNLQRNSSITVPDFNTFLRQTVEPETDADGVVWQFDECSVCLSSCRFVRRPPCCRTSICGVCWNEYVRVSSASSPAFLLTGMYDLHCFACDAIVPYSQALNSLGPDVVALVRPSRDVAYYSRCPNCFQPPPPAETNRNESLDSFITRKRRKSGGLPLQCGKCDAKFCGACGQDVHPTMSCAQLVHSNKAVKQWMRLPSLESPEYRNGRHCPSCCIPLSREGGSPIMKCRCGASLCYSCGQKRIHCRLLPGHTSNRLLPLVSCPKLWASQPKRIAVHSLISIGMLAGVGPLLVGLSPVLAPLSVVAYALLKDKKP